MPCKVVFFFSHCMPCYKYLKFKHMGTEKAICNMEVLPRQVYEKYALVPGDRQVPKNSV